TVARHLYLTGRDVDDLLVGVEVDAAVSALAADSTALDPTERSAQVTNVVRIQPDHARPDRTRDPVTTPAVVGLHLPREAVLDVVGESERFLLRVERCQCHDRTEDLLLEDPGITADVGEHRGGEVVALRKVLRTSAAGDECRLRFPGLDIVGHP